MNTEQKRMLIRILASAALLAIAWALKLSGVARAIAFLAPYALCGWDVVYKAARNILKGRVFDEQLLMTVATLGAIALGDYPEAVFVMLFYQTGEWFQDRAVDKSRDDIAKLMNIRPDSATVVREGVEARVAPEAVCAGETIIVRPGERIPLDGCIISGATTVDASSLTGESLPKDCQEGERVYSGTINLTGVIRVKTIGEYAQSTVSKILELVENASEKKAKTENFITRFSRLYTPCVMAAALMLALLPPICFGLPFADWLRRALIFLVVSCPCALVVSVPLTFFSGLGAASRAGILIKGSNYLEALSGASIMVFDKTGTLTRGKFTVTCIHPERMSEAELLDIAAAAELNSSHPIAQSIIDAHGGHIDKSRIGDVSETPGQGVTARIDGREIYAGNEQLMRRAGAEIPECSHEGTLIHISEGRAYLGHIEITDEYKPDARAAVAEIRELGVKRVVLLTGDSQASGARAGIQLGIGETRAELMPADKVAAVEALIEPGKTLAFAGDGINDAPVLARADVGIAMGALGSDAAIEAADVVLMDDKPSKIPRAIRIARKTMRIVKQNIVLTLSCKAVVLALGALGVADMWFAVFADVGILMIATINAMRAQKSRTQVTSV